MEYSIGSLTHRIFGDITTLNAIVLADKTLIAKNLGYHAGRLSKGYEILLLKSLPVPSAFEFQGTTLRSGGHLGAPKSDHVLDKQRTRVHDQIMDERGVSGYDALQKKTLQNVEVEPPLVCRRL